MCLRVQDLPPHVLTERTHNIVMNRKQLVKAAYWFNSLGCACLNAADNSFTEEEYEEHYRDAHAWWLLESHLAWVL